MRCSCLGAALLVIGTAHTQAQSLPTGIPEEFLDLVNPLDGDAPERRPVAEGEFYVDFYVDGIWRGDILISVKEKTLQFDDPKQAAGLIDDLRRREKFEALLAQDFALDGGPACLTGGKISCPAPIIGRFGILLDTEDQRLDLYRSSRFKTPPTPLKPSHPHDIGLVAGLTSRFSGSTSGGETQTNASFSFNAITGRGPDSAFVEGFANQDGDVSIFEAGVQTFRGRYRAAGGFLRSDSSDFISQLELIGGEFHTTDLTQDSDAATIDTPVLVFLARASYVDVFRDGQLLYSDFFQSGPARIPTRDFPSGSYDIVLTIRDENGEERSEQRFFTRTSTVRRWSFSVQGGMTRERNANPFSGRRDGLPYGAFRIGRPIGTRELFSTRIGMLDKTAFVETSLSGFYGPLFWEISGLGTSEGGYGAVARLSGALSSVNVSARGRYSVLDEGSHPFQRSILGRNAEATLNVSAPMLLIGGWVSGFGRFVDRSNFSTGTSFGATWNRPVPLWDRRTSGQFTLSFQDTGREKRIELRFRLTRSQKRSTLSGSVGARHKLASRNRKIESTQDARWILRSDPRAARPWSVGARISNSGSTDPIAGIDGRIRTPNVIADARIDQSFSSPGRTSYFGTVATSLAASPHGVDVTGYRDADAGALIDMRDDTESGGVQVSVDGRIEELERKVRFVPLAPFQSHALRLRPKSGEALKYEAGIIRTNAFPGNVVHLNPKFLRLVSLFGRIVDEDGTPLANTPVTVAGDRYLTDEAGYFIFDAPAGITAFEGRLKEDERCIIKLPGLEDKEDLQFIDLGNLTCGQSG